MASGRYDSTLFYCNECDFRYRVNVYTFIQRVQHDHMGI